MYAIKNYSAPMYAIEKLGFPYMPLDNFCNLFIDTSAAFIIKCRSLLQRLMSYLI